ncbi:MAG: DNA primase [Candidatus Aenigmatarchaeota archaeon]|nr:MAG: DNA primase [Candidatus Aenigmarchaeota archaeon]
MAKLAQNFAKYLIHARLSAQGVIEKPDVIGAIFGQTEGLLGADLDLRELQRTGRIGRIEVKVTTRKGSSEAYIIIPSSLDASETSLIASSLETIEKVGPCDAKIRVERVEDVRSQKRRYVIDRAKEILKQLMEEGIPDSQKISEMIKESVRSWEVSSYNGLSCGPNITDYDEIIIVEGRADVINLLKNGIRNVIAIEGSKIPKAICDLTKEKITTAFLDGDRGGDLDLKKLLSVADIDFVARAEKGKEVEDLSKKQIYKALREKTPVDQVIDQIKANGGFVDLKEEKTEPKRLVDDRRASVFKELLDQLTGTHAAFLVDDNLKTMSKIPVSELQNVIHDFSNIHALVFDGKIDQAMVDLAAHKNIKYLVGTGFKQRVDFHSVTVLTPKNLVR